MKIFSLILGLLVVAQFSAYAGDRHCKTEKVRTVAEQLANLAKADLDLIDLDMFPGGSFTAGYRYEVEPAYTKGLYKRVDKWQIETKAIPGKPFDFNANIHLNIAGGLQNKNEATFIRFMDDPCKAMLASPYSPRRIPLKASGAIGDKFHVGDYFLFRGSVGIVASADVLGLLGTPIWGVTLSGSYLVEGFYQIHVVRLDETHVRLKVVAHRGQNASVAMGLGYRNEFDIFQVNFLNNALERIVNTNPLRLHADKGKSKVFMVDYFLDLTDPQVAKAYESIIGLAKNFKNLNKIAPFKKTDLEHNVLLDLSPLEDIFRADYQANNVGRIKRNLKTTSEQNSYGFGVNMGNKIIGFKANGSIATANMGIRQDDDTLDKYLLRSWDKSWEGKFMWSLVRASKEESLRALFKTDNNFENLTPINIVKHINQRKNRISYRNFQKVKKTLLKALPTEIYNQIPWENWVQGNNQKFTNFGLRYELLMAPESIMELPELSQEEIKAFFLNDMRKKQLTSRDFFLDAPGEAYPENPQRDYDRNLDHMARLLSKALDKKISVKDRLEIITKLRWNQIFAETGFGFLMSLRPEMMKKWYHLDLDISSNEALIDFSYGDSELSTLYKKILTIKAALDDSALDLLREAESLSTSKAPEEPHAA